jgi:hypothetical protein
MYADEIKVDDAGARQRRHRSVSARRRVVKLAFLDTTYRFDTTPAKFKFTLSGNRTVV